VTGLSSAESDTRIDAAQSNDPAAPDRSHAEAQALAALVTRTEADMN